MAPTKEEFQAWQSHPITRWVFKGARTGTQAQKAAWDKAAWDKGSADQLLLTELRTRADAYAALEETTYEGWCELNGDSPTE